MSEKDQTETAVLDQEIVDEILQEETGKAKDRGRLVRLERDQGTDNPQAGADENAKD